MNKRSILVFAAAFVLSCGTALSGVTVSTASAQEVQITGPLAGAPAVRRLRIYREGRFQVMPSLGFSLQDQFSRYISFNLQANYHFTDWLGLGVWGFGAPIQIGTSLTGEVVRQGATTARNRLSLPLPANFNRQVGSLDWGIGLQALFIPLRGKLALFQGVFLDADLYLALGVTMIGVTERADTPDPMRPEGPVCGGATASEECLSTQTARASRVAVAPLFGVGISVHANQFIAVVLEWRAFPFNWNTSGTDERGASAMASTGGGVFPDGRVDGQDQLFQFNHQFTLGVAFYLPTEARTND